MAATMVKAINTALREAMAEDERVVVFGQDVARQGGVFRVTEGLAERAWASAAVAGVTTRSPAVDEGPRTLGLGAEIAARVQEELFWDLEAPVLRVTGFDTPYPPARWEKAWLPGVDRLLDSIDRSFGYGHD